MTADAGNPLSSAVVWTDMPSTPTPTITIADGSSLVAEVQMAAAFYGGQPVDLAIKIAGTYYPIGCASGTGQVNGWAGRCVLTTPGAGSYTASMAYACESGSTCYLRPATYPLHEALSLSLQEILA
jgi:hypothetical protein